MFRIKHLLSALIAVIAAGSAAAQSSSDGGDILPLTELVATATPSRGDVASMPADARLLAHLDLAAVAKDPRLSLLGLDGMAELFGIFGAQAGALDGMAQGVTIAGWPQGETTSGKWEVAMLFTGRFEAAAMKDVLGSRASSFSTINGEEVLQLQVEGSAEPMYLKVIDEKRARLGTAEGMRRWLNASTADGPGRALIAASAVPSDASAWFVVDLSPEQSEASGGSARSADDSGVRGLAASVVASNSTTIRARLTLADAAQAEGMAASLRLLPSVFGAGGPSPLSGIASKLRSLVDDRVLAVELSLEDDELPIFRAAALAMAPRMKAMAGAAPQQPTAEPPPPASSSGVSADAGAVPSDTH